MTNLYSYECQNYNTFMLKMYPYYVQSLYIHIIFKKCQNYIH